MKHKTKIKIINGKKLKYDEKEIKKLVEKFKYTKENLDKTNKKKDVNEQEKFNGYIVEDFLSQALGYKRNEDIFGWWDLKTELNGKTIYFDSKTLLTDKELEGDSSFKNKEGKKITYSSGITNKKQKFGKTGGKDNWGNDEYKYKSVGFCVYLQAKQVLDIKKHCDENNVNYEDYYFIINYFNKDTKEVKSVFSTKFRLDQVLKTIRLNENPPNTTGNSDEVDNFIIYDIYKDGYSLENVN